MPAWPSLPSDAMARSSPPRPTTSPAGTRTSCNKAELAENGPVRGTMVIRPYGYAHLGADAGRGRRPHQGVRRRERLLPAVHPRVVPPARGRARRGVQPRAGGGHHRRRQGARGAGRRPAHQRDGHRRVHGQVDPELPRPAAAAQPVGQRRALGAAPAPLPAHHRVPLAGGPHRARHARTTRARTPSASCTRSTRTSWSNVLAMPVVVGLQDREGALRRRRPTRSRARR